MTATADRFFKNSVFQITLNVISKLLVFVFVSCAVRSYGTEIYGKYAFTISIVTLFYLFSDLGLGTYIIKEIAKEKRQASLLFYNKLVINILSGLFGYAVLLAVFIVVRQQEHVYGMLALAGITVITQGISTSYGSLFAGHERLDLNALVEMGGNLFIYLVSVLLAILKMDIMFLVGIYVLGSILKVAAARYLVRSMDIELDRSFNTKYWKTMLMGAIPLFAITVFYRIYFSIDSTILWFLKGNIAVGRYNPAFRILEVTQSIPLLFMGAIFPVMARMGATDHEKLRWLYEKTLKAFMAMGIPLAFFCFVYAQDITQLIYGSSCDPGIVQMFRILIWTVIFIYGDQLMGNFFIATDRSSVVIPVVVVCAIFNIVANLIIIPVLDITGAAITSLATEILQFSLFFIINHFKYNYRVKAAPFAGIIVFSASIAVCLAYLQKCGIHSLVMLLPAAVVYCAFLLVAKIVQEEDVAIVKGFIQRKITGGPRWKSQLP